MACEKICIRCGEAFAAKRSSALRCPSCRVAINVERTAARRKRLRAMKPPPEPGPRKKPDRDKHTHFIDPPERIAKCLNCNRAICYGTCYELTRRKNERT